MNKKIIWGIVIAVIVIAGIATLNVSNSRMDCCDGEQYATSTAPATTSQKYPDVPMNDITNTSTWKTYYNSEFKVEVKYPQSWSYSTNGETGPLHEFWFWYVKNPLDDKSNIVLFKHVDACTASKEISLAGQKIYDSGWKLNSNSTQTRTICFPDKLYSISLETLDEKSKAMEEALLTTIKFTSTDTSIKKIPADLNANWIQGTNSTLGFKYKYPTCVDDCNGQTRLVNVKTYTNEKYGFEFKYPKEWSGRVYGVYQVSAPVSSLDLNITGPTTSIIIDDYGGSGIKGENIIFAGKDSINIGWQKFQNSFIRTIRINETPLSIRMTATSKSDKVIIDRILSTFKFIN